MNTKTQEQFEAILNKDIKDVINAINTGRSLENMQYSTVIKLIKLVLKRIDETERNLLGRE